MNPSVRALASQVERLMVSQWEAASGLEIQQRERLHRLAEYAARHSPLIRQRLAEAALTPTELATPGGLARMPLLRRRDLQLAAKQLYCAEVPPEHGEVHNLRTSGSTGEPVVVRRTVLTDFHWNALTMRDHLWHEIEFSGRFSAVRPTLPNHVRLPNWGPPTSLLFRTGAAEAIPVAAEARQQAQWLLEFSPQVLLSFPSVAEAIAGHLRESGRRLPELRRVKSIGETLSPRLREAIQTGLGAPIVDIYSSHEVGIIAVQCPQSSLYHVMAENLIVEVLNEDGGPCAEGEAGRVAITDLHNYATPMIRYEIGDWAEPGGLCPCGRGLSTLRRILGRERNLVKMPDGTRRYPLVGFVRFREVAPVLQYQFIQHALDRLEMRLVTETPLRAAQEEDLAAIVRKALGFSFALDFTYFPERLPRSPSGKFEEFVCRI